MIRCIAASILLILCSAVASGSSYAVRSWQSEDGLPVNVVRSIVQSADGYLWIASAEGIARFDGTEFVTLEMPQGIRLPRIGPNRLFATPDGSVWFSGPRVGLLRIQNDTVEQIIPEESSPKPQYFTQVVAMSDERIVARRGNETWLVSLSPPILYDPPTKGMDRAFAEDLVRRAIEGRILPEGNQPGRLIDLNNNVWSNTEHNGISVISPEGTPVSLDFGNLEQNPNASEFLVDREGNIWVATSINGLLRFRQHRAEIIDESDGLSERSANAVIEDADKHLWIGMRSGGVDRLSGDVVEHFEFSPNTSGLRRTTSALYIDRDKRLWTAARDGSVFIWNGTSFDPAFPKSAIPSKVDALYQDGDNCFWFGGVNGLVKVQDDSINKIQAKDGLPPCHITTMAGGPTDRLWFGTVDGRVFRHENDNFIQLGKPSELSGKAVSALFVESPTRAWATTLGAGLNFWNGNYWTRIDGSDGLPDARLTSIIPDETGNLWLGSLGGIIRIPLKDLNGRIEQSNTPLHWLLIDRSDGLPTSECSGSSRPSGWRGSDGKIYFPTAGGVALVDPSTIDINLQAPTLFLEKFTANSVPIKITDQPVAIGPGRTRLEFSYHGLSLSAPEKTTYRTRLTGLDETWRDVGTQRLSTFEAVPPGRYQFEVTAINGDGISSEPATIANIIIKPHFWETSWFIFLGILTGIIIAAGTGSLLVRIRLKRRIHDLKINQALETERSRISRDLHDDLGASLTELSILSALAAESRDESTLRPSMSLVSSKAKTVVGTLDEIVWAATPSEDSLRSLADYLSAFIREFLENVEINLRTDVPRNIPDYYLGPNRRHNVFLACKEAVNNAAKYSGATNLRLQITIEQELLVITISDNGRGFIIEEVSSGNGLRNLKKRMTDCGGDCMIQSTRLKGTTVTLSLPLPGLPEASPPP
jgi:signal transduction histidine kinase/ligand-binding sensor domain-containing protein